MSLTATISQPAEYLQILNNKVQPSAPADTTIYDKQIAALAQIPLFGDATHLYYRNRVRLVFSIAENIQSRFALLRGLVEFNRDKRFIFAYNRQQKSIETDIALNDLGALQDFFSGISALLNKEIAFKQALKSVLAFEARYKAEKELVYATLAQ